MNKPYSLFIIDDHNLLRETWIQVVQCNPKYVVAGAYRSAEDALEAAKIENPDIILLDINLPDMNGIEATAQFCKYAPGVKIIGVSHHSQPAFARQMMRNGAVGFVTKNSGKEELFKALDAAANGDKYICEEIKTKIADQFTTEDKDVGSTLSKREIEIIRLLKKGFSSKEAAQKLFLSTKTIEVHRYNILKKLKLKNIASLINYIHSQPQL